MQVSGFSFVRNGIKLGYPIVEAIKSILPICDEFVIAIGASEDDTLEKIRAIGNEKINIIETVWDEKYFVRGAINAQQTNVALSNCTGDWCFYLQADEVVHEKFLPVIRSRMEELQNDNEVEGLLFDYLHFWGSYDFIQRSRSWYRREVRVVRNGIGVESWQSAQGFRLNGKKLKVAKVDGYIYHYGWVRPPSIMKEKQRALDSIHHDQEWVEKKHTDEPGEFDYGNPDYLKRFSGNHPEVMKDRIAAHNWDFSSGEKAGHAHETLFDRFRTFLEDRVLHHRIGEYKNYVLLKGK